MLCSAPGVLQMYLLDALGVCTPAPVLTWLPTCQVIKPRGLDKQNCAAGKGSYDYGAELFSTRRKDFWQLQTSKKVRLWAAARSASRQVETIRRWRL